VAVPDKVSASTLDRSHPALLGNSADILQAHS
jgi:hypothetical protein